MFKTLNNGIQWTKSLCRYFSHSKGWSPQILSWIFNFPQDLRLSRKPHEGGLSITVSCHHLHPHIFFTRPLYSSPDNVFLIFFSPNVCKEILFILIDSMMKSAEMVFHKYQSTVFGFRFHQWPQECCCSCGCGRYFGYQESFISQKERKGKCFYVIFIFKC